MPGEELGDRAPRPFAVDRAVERLELRRVLRALRLGDGRRRQAVDAADAFGDAAENGEFAGAGKSAGADRRSAERAVIVRVDEARRERAAARVDDPVGGRRLRGAHRAERDDAIVFDQDVAGIAAPCVRRR